jgi:hypothetical protein
VLRFIRIVLSLCFGFAVWTALCLGVGAKSCTDDFEWAQATSSYEVAMMFGLGLWIPMVLVIAGIAYFVATRGWYFRSPIARALSPLVIVGLVFGAAVLFTHKFAHCVDF